MIKNAKHTLRLIVLVSAILSAGFASAWVQTGNTQVKELVQWEGTPNSNVVVLLNSGHACYIPADNEQLYSLLLALYISGKTFNLHCYDAQENIHGYPAHRIYRVNSL